jgi:hypothetical protein
MTATVVSYGGGANSTALLVGMVAPTEKGFRRKGASASTGNRPATVLRLVCQLWK